MGKSMSTADGVALEKIWAFFDSRGRNRPANPNTNLLASGLLDSLDLAVFLTYLESEFDIDIAPTEVSPEHFGSIAATLEFLNKKHKKQ